MLERLNEGDELWRLECDLAFRWRYCADRLALKTLLERFEPLVYAVASERYTTCQLDKGFVTPRNGDAPPAGVFEDLLAEGRLGLIEAANRFDGRNRFSTYAREWIFKRMQEFVRFNWSVVRQPEPAEWKVSKEDQIPRTHPSPGMNPFENPYSIDKKSRSSRHASYSTPVDNDGSRSPEEWWSAGSTSAPMTTNRGFLALVILRAKSSKPPPIRTWRARGTLLRWKR